jgi:hypothetical protein
MKKIIILFFAVMVLQSVFLSCKNDDIETDNKNISGDSLAEQIKSGNFFNVYDANGEKLDEWVMESLNFLYTKKTEWINPEWVEYDLNSDRLKGLIWQEQINGREPYRIHCIFALEDDKARLILFTAGMQMTDIYFLGSNGNIINTYSTNGINSSNIYYHCIYDERDLKAVYGLQVIRIYDWAINEAKENGYYEDLLEEFPYWAEAGVYYWESANKDENNNFIYEEINEQQFLKNFEEMMGHSFYASPVKPDWTENGYKLDFIQTFK